MKVLLFAVSAKYRQAWLHYRSGDPLTIEELEILRDYVMELIGQKQGLMPKQSDRKTEATT